MLNLFLAVLLGNFDNARNYMEKKKLFLEFEKCKKKNMDLKKSLKYVLGKVFEQVILYTGIFETKNKKKEEKSRRVHIISSVSSKPVLFTEERYTVLNQGSQIRKKSSLPVKLTKNRAITPKEVIQENSEKIDHNRMTLLSKLNPFPQELHENSWNTSEKNGRKEELKSNLLNVMNNKPANQQDEKAYDELINSKSKNGRSIRLASNNGNSKKDYLGLEMSYEEQKMNTKTEKLSNLRSRRENEINESEKMKEIFEETSLKTSEDS